MANDDPTQHSNEQNYWFKIDYKFLRSIVILITFQLGPALFFFVIAINSYTKYYTDNIVTDILVAIIILDDFIVSAYLMLRTANTEKADDITSFDSVLIVIWGFCVIASFIFAFASVYIRHGILYTGSHPPGLSDPNLDALYFSVITWTTLGYGDFIPSAECRPWAAAEALTGYAMMALFIAALVGLFKK